MKKIFFLIVIFSVELGFSQTLSSWLSKQKVEVGEPLEMQIKVQDLEGKTVISAQKNALLPFAFEEHRDETVIDNNHYIRTIEFSLSKEGTHSIPPLEFKIGDSIYKTIPYEIEVGSLLPQREDIHDILPNAEIQLTWEDYWQMYKIYFFLGLMGLGIIPLLLWWNLQRKKKRIAPTDCFEQGLKKLYLLQKKNYLGKGEPRLFYIELMEITREFISHRYGIPAEVLLTEDLVDFIKNKSSISLENVTMIDTIFTRGDSVKFAKIIPENATMQQDFDQIKNWISLSKTISTNG